MKRLIVLATAAIVGACAAQPPQPAATAYSGSTVPQPQASPAVRDAQQRLRNLGFYNGAIDGIAGPDTLLALERYQTSRGLEASGRLTPATIAALQNEPRPAPRSAAVAPSAPTAPLDATNVRALQNRLRQLGFYGGSVDGVWGSSTQDALERFQRTRGLEVTGTLTPATANALGVEPEQTPRQTGIAQPLEPAVARNIQSRLAQLGFYTGAADGIMGPATKNAIERFQESRGLAVTGDLNPTTITALGLDPNNLAESAAPRGGYGATRR